MKKEKSQARKRFESFLWRAGMMGLAAALAYGSENISNVEMGTGFITIVGLVFGEISKFIYNQYKE